MEIVLYPFKKGQSGVYELIINEWVYIGSSECLHRRQANWCNYFKSNKGLPKRIVSLINKSIHITIVFRLIELIDDKHERLQTERERIERQLTLGNCLNFMVSSFYLKKDDSVHHPVLQYLGKKLVMRHDNALLAAIHLNVKSWIILASIHDNKRKVKGYIFKYDTANRFKFKLKAN